MNDFLKIDGSKITLTRNNVNEIYIPKSVEQFFDSANQRRIMAGPKGSGKSLLLSLRKKLDNLSENDQFDYPKGAIDSIMLTFISFNAKYYSNKNDSDWELIFKIAIQYYLSIQILKTINDKETEVKFFGNYFESCPIRKELLIEGRQVVFSSILELFLNSEFHLKLFTNKLNVNLIENFLRLSVEFLRNIADQKHSIRYYIDNIDQALYKILGLESDFIALDINQIADFNEHVKTYKILNNGRDNTKNTKSNIVVNYFEKISVWFSCQIGMIKAINEINKINSQKLFVFATIRSEVLNYSLISPGRGKGLNLDYICSITFEKNELAEIAERLIKSSNIKDVDLELFQLKTLRHSQIFLPNLDTENLVTYLVRHSLKNPRDIARQIISLSNRVAFYSKDNINKSRVEDFKSNMANVYREILNEFKDEMLPSFPHNEFDSFIKKVKSNVIEYTFEDKHVLKFLYNIGLIGFLKPDCSGYKQTFKPLNNYCNNLNDNLPNSKAFLIHPILDNIFMDLASSNKYYYKYSIIGDGLNFIFKHPDDFYIPPFLHNPKGNDAKLKNKLYKLYLKNDTTMGHYEQLRIKIHNEYFPFVLEKLNNKIPNMNFSVNDEPILSLINFFNNVLEKNIVKFDSDNLNDNIQHFKNTQEFRIMFSILLLFNILNENNFKEFKEKLVYLKNSQIHLMFFKFSFESLKQKVVSNLSQFESYVIKCFLQEDNKYVRLNPDLKKFLDNSKEELLESIIYKELEYSI